MHAAPQITASHREMTTSRLIAIGFALLLAIGLAALGTLSFERRVNGFQPLGFSVEHGSGKHSGQPWRILTVDSTPSELQPGDLLLLVNGTRPQSYDHLATLVTSQPQSEILVQRGAGRAPTIRYQRPALNIDFAYLLLTASGLLYLLIGLYTALRGSGATVRIFYLWCLAAAAYFILSPRLGPPDRADQAILLVEQLARLLLPALTLHLFLVFPNRPAITWLRRATPFLYLPAALLTALHSDLFFFQGRYFAGSLSAAKLQLLDRIDLLLLVAFTALAVIVLAFRRARQKGWEARRQMQWMAIGLVTGYGPFLVLYVAPWSLGLSWPGWTSTLAVLFLGLVPVTFAWAILRYKLLEIGSIVRQSVALTLAAIAGLFTFALLQLGLERALSDSQELARNLLTFSGGLAIAGVLLPLRSAVSAGLERLQYGNHLGSRRALHELGRELLGEHQLAQLAPRLVDSLASGLAVEPVELYLKNAAGEFVASAPQADLSRLPRGSFTGRFWNCEVDSLSPVELSEGELTSTQELFLLGFRYAFPLLTRHPDGDPNPIGVLVTGYHTDQEPLSNDDLNLTRGLLNQAALAIENARLLGEVRQQLTQVTQLREHSRGIIESSPAGIVVLDAGCRITSANRAFCAIVGCREAIEGQPLKEVLPVSPLPLVEGGSVEVSYCEMNGRERHLRLSIAPFNSPDSQTEGFRILVLHDSSERVALEQELAEKERLAALGMLAAGVAHEVNTPLTGISSYAQMLMQGMTANDPRRELLKKVEQQTFRASQIVNNLLEFSRNRRHEPRLVDLVGVLSECVEQLAPRTYEAAVEVLWNPPTEPLRVLGNEGELGQVFTNLLANAVEAMAPLGGGRLQIGARQQNQRLLIEIRDQGPGIAKERIERIFEPFFSSRLGRGGTGLGLAICQNIVRRHRGTLRARNRREGTGSTFTVELPSSDSGNRG